MKPDCVENYTKAEILIAMQEVLNDGGFPDYDMRPDLLLYLQRNAYQKSIKNEMEATNAEISANAEFLNFSKELKNKYGTRAIEKATTEEQKKYCDLKAKHLKAVVKLVKTRKEHKKRTKLLTSNETYIELKKTEEFIKALRESNPSAIF